MRGGHLDEMRPARDGTVRFMEGFCSVPGPLQTVQRAAFWGYPCLAVLGCSSFGVDNLNIVLHVGRLLDGTRGSRPVELENDGDLLALLREMIERRG